MFQTLECAFNTVECKSEILHQSWIHFFVFLPWSGQIFFFFGWMFFYSRIEIFSLRMVGYCILSVREVVVRRCSAKKAFLKISQNWQENTCARVSFSVELQASTTLLKKKLWHRCFHVSFVKFVRTPFSIEHLLWLFLQLTVLFKVLF